MLVSIIMFSMMLVGIVNWYGEEPLNWYGEEPLSLRHPRGRGALRRS
jgi:hypothetical protein